MADSIFLVRHGETYWNAAEKEKHQTHSEGKNNLLTERGIKQAKHMANILKNEQIDYIFYSPLRRAKQTIEKILIYHPNSKIFEEKRITEISMSFLDGMHQSEWEKRFPETISLYEARKKDKYGCELPEDVDFSKCYEEAKKIAEANGEPNKVIPPWENYRMGSERINPFLDEIKSLKGNVLICAHQQVNRVIIGSLLEGTGYIKDNNEVAYLKTPNYVVFRIDYLNREYKLFHKKDKEWIKGLIK